jgi:hypothetical protein
VCKGGKKVGLGVRGNETGVALLTPFLTRTPSHLRLRSLPRRGKQERGKAYTFPVSKTLRVLPK